MNPKIIEAVSQTLHAVADELEHESKDCYKSSQLNTSQIIVSTSFHVTSIVLEHLAERFREKAKAIENAFEEA